MASGKGSKRMDQNSNKIPTKLNGTSFVINYIGPSSLDELKTWNTLTK